MCTLQFVDCSINWKRFFFFLGVGGRMHFVLPLTLVNFILVSCSTPTTLSMAIPDELAGAIPVLNRFQVGRYILYLLT
jgi:hypothetical protein